MMKKLMVLSLVMAIGAVSSAALSIVDLGGGQFGLEGPANNNVTWYLGATSGLDVMGTLNLTDRVAELGLSKVEHIGYLSWSANVAGGADYMVDVWSLTVASGPTTPTVAGVQVAGQTNNLLGWGADDMGMGGIFLADGQFRQVDAAYVIPEPMTMGLLGVGALFLRRRK